MTRSDPTPQASRGADLAKTAVVVVNYGSSSLLEANLSSVSDDAPEATYVVVDNFTSVGEQDEVRRLAADKGWLAVLLDENTGFGRGVNAGASVAIDAGMTALLVLNPDATIRRASVERLVAAVADDPMLMVAPIIRRSNGQLWFSGSDLDLRSGDMRNPRNRVGVSGVEYREWLTGACFAISAELWGAVGGFDDDYFLYWEDVDLSYRVTEAGGRLAIDQGAEAIHDAGGTHVEVLRGRAKSETYYYYNIRNRLLYAAKNLDDDALERWRRATLRASYEILLRGGRRQFLRPLIPFRALFRGVRDGRRFVRSVRPGGGVPRR